MPTCRVGLTAGGDLQSITFDSGTKVSDVVQLAAKTPHMGDQFLINGKPVPPDTPVRNGDLVLLAPPIVGG